MAGDPQITVEFEGECPDCGRREVDLPAPLPPVGDDFDWHVRDYDGFRLFMMEELVARFPERTRWTPADMEVVLVEALAAVLDQLSDMLDRVAAEAFLETARRPESVRRLLKLIGYDAMRMAGIEYDAQDPESEREAIEALERLWMRDPHAMGAARLAGPRAIHTQRRMVTEEDCAERLEEHPLVLRAHAWSRWSGSWLTGHVAVIAWQNLLLDETLPEAPHELQDRAAQWGMTVDDLQAAIENLRIAIDRFHAMRGLKEPVWAYRPTIRTLLRSYVDAYRMAGHEVLLQDAVPVGIVMALSMRVASNYFQSEVRRAVEAALGTGPGGFFEFGRLSFGEDLHAADILQALLDLEGVETVCLNRFKRIGKRYRNQIRSGRIALEGLEIAVCDNDPAKPERGYFMLHLQGGRTG